MICFDPTQTFEFVLKEERDINAEDQTVFVLKRLTARERAGIQDQLMLSVNNDNDKGTHLKLGTQHLNILSIGVKEVRNLKFPDGNLFDIKDKTGPKLCDVIDYKHVVEIVDAITEGSTVEEADQKN